MLFTSLEFLFLFLPVTIGVYYVIPRLWGLRNVWLLAASLLFYAWGEPSFVFIMLASIAFNYVMALLIDVSRGRKRLQNGTLAFSIIINLSVIGVWKYANFITATLRSWMPCCQGAIPQTSFLLPIGISFFTFQAMSYVVDVARGNVKVQRNPISLALYVALFPQLVAGPIVRYNTVCNQINLRRESLRLFSSGVFRFLIGFNKKMFLANGFAVTADKFFGLQELSVCGAWLGAVAYTFQIFFDFSGYSDMAIGLGRMFGFEFLENFNYPYISRSITEFWRRWHMSLGTWFRDYLYFPLGGSRVLSRSRLILNLSVVWLATGIWHGANWTFILWGTLYGALIVVEKLTRLPQRIESAGRIGWLTWFPTMFFVVLGWVLFRSPDLTAAGQYLRAMFGLSAATGCTALDVFELCELRVLLPAAMLASVPWTERFLRLIGSLSRGTASGMRVLGAMASFLLFVVGISYLVMNAHNPFIYFNF